MTCFYFPMYNFKKNFDWFISTWFFSPTGFRFHSSIFSPNCYIFFFPWFFSWIFLTWPFLKMNFYMIHIFFFKILLFTNCSFIFMWFSFHITNMWYFSLTRFIDFFFFFTSIYMSFGFIYHILLTWCVYLSSVSGHDIMKYTFTCEKH